MKKKLNEDMIANELKTGSSFFKRPVQKSIQTDSPSTDATDKKLNKTNTYKKGFEKIKANSKKSHKSYTNKKISEQEKPSLVKQQISRPKEEKKDNSETTTPRYHDTTVSQHHNTNIETIRKAVKILGKEAATYRFTAEEKKALSDIVYTYKTTGVRTSENEITRTAINFIVQDYEQNGKNSILAQVIERLNS